MGSSKFISHQSIQQGFLKSSSSIIKYILQPMNINPDNITLKQLMSIICDDLVKMNFRVIKTDKLYDNSGRSVPGFTGFKTKQRSDGGIIKLNKNYPSSIMLETLIHEYVHIKNENLLILPIVADAANSVALHNELLLKTIELHVEICTNLIIMPPAKICTALLQTGYDIDDILLKYKDFDKRTILKWVSLINHNLECHFACVFFEKSHSNKIVNTILDESYTYDHKNDPEPFYLFNILSNKNSAAAMACKSGKPTNIHKETNIDGIDYYCYAYYECDLKKEVVNDNIPGTTKINYDRLVVIGWKKQDYAIMQVLKSFIPNKITTL